MIAHPTPIAGMFVIQTSIHRDARGEFERLFCRRDWTAVRPGLDFVQSNRSLTRGPGTVRGLHYQRAPRAEAKLIRCVRGAVFDVAVDLRRDSPTFLAWHAVELDAGSGREVFIPEGCAHGFQVTGEEAELIYFHTAFHSPEAEAGLHADDPALGIAWPLPVTGLSPRDRSHPWLTPDFAGERA